MLPLLRCELNELVLAKLKALELAQSGRFDEGKALLERGLADAVDRRAAGLDYGEQLEAAWRKALDDLVAGRGVRANL